MTFRMRKAGSRPWPVKFTLLDSNEEGEVAPIEQGFIGFFVPFNEQQYDDIIAEEERKFFGIDAAIVEANATAGESLAVIPQAPPIGERPPHVTLALNARIFARFMNGWSKVMDADGNPIAYSTAALAELVTGPDGMAISVGINQALAQIRFGIAPAKNAQASPAPGLVPASGEAASTS